MDSYLNRSDISVTSRVNDSEREFLDLLKVHQHDMRLVISLS